MILKRASTCTEERPCLNCYLGNGQACLGPAALYKQTRGFTNFQRKRSIDSAIAGEKK